MSAVAVILEPQRAALERLLAIAARDTGQSLRVADFLLAWWNAGTCGGFDLTTMWGCDRAIVEDMVTVFRYVGHHSYYPDSLGYGPQFEAVVRAWRPELVEEKPGPAAISARAPCPLGDDVQVTFTTLERTMLLTAIEYYQAASQRGDPLAGALGDTPEELAALQTAKEIITG
jgi:hypothetical protein